jgi:hypothetical protein
VPQSQRRQYAAVVPEILCHPDSVRGLTPKLNWILDRFKSEDAIVFLDDDLVSVARCFVGPGEMATTIRQPALVHEIIEHTAQLAADLDVKMFGWEASNGAIRYYTGLKPIMLTGYINGCAMGYRRGHGLRFDESIVAKNDYDICLMNAYLHRRCLKNCRYTFNQKATFTGAGGQSAWRNSETEKNDVRLLRQKYGDVIRAGGFSGTRKRDYAGVAKIEMHLPF